MMDPITISYIVEGVAVTAVLYVVYLNHQERKRWDTMIANHMQHETEAMGEVKLVLQGLKDLIVSLTMKIGD